MKPYGGPAVGCIVWLDPSHDNDTDSDNDPKKHGCNHGGVQQKRNAATGTLPLREQRNYGNDATDERSNNDELKGEMDRDKSGSAIRGRNKGARISEHE